MGIIYADDKSFNDEIIAESVLVDFYADWCGPCKMLNPILENIAKERNETKIIKVNVDKVGNVTKKYGIMSIPTLIHFKKGNMISKKVGLCSKDEIIEMINE